MKYYLYVISLFVSTFIASAQLNIPFESVDSTLRYNKIDSRGRKTGIWLEQGKDFLTVEFYSEDLLDFYSFTFHESQKVEARLYDHGNLKSILPGENKKNSKGEKDGLWVDLRDNDCLASVYESDCRKITVILSDGKCSSIFLYDDNGHEKEAYYSGFTPDAENIWSFAYKDVRYNDLPVSTLYSIPTRRCSLYSYCDRDSLFRISDCLYFDSPLSDSSVEIEYVDYDINGKLTDQYKDDILLPPLEYFLDTTDPNYNIHNGLLFNKIDNNGQKTGIWIETGSENRIIEFYESGLLESYRYIFGEDDSVRIEFYNQGKLEETIVAENNYDATGKKNRIWFEKEGEFQVLRFYVHGIFDGPVIYLCDGSPVFIGTFDKGNPSGTWYGTSNIWKGAGAPLWSFCCYDFQIITDEPLKYSCSYLLCEPINPDNRYSSGQMQFGPEIMHEGCGNLEYDYFPVIGEESFTLHQ